MVLISSKCNLCRSRDFLHTLTKKYLQTPENCPNHTARCTCSFPEKPLWSSGFQLCFSSTGSGTALLRTVPQDRRQSSQSSHIGFENMQLAGRIVSTKSSFSKTRHSPQQNCATASEKTLFYFLARDAARLSSANCLTPRITRGKQTRCSQTIDPAVTLLILFHDY